jgi:uncharacterized protein (TIGR00297 family)
VDNMLVKQLLWGAILALAAAWLGYRAGALNRSGAIAAWIMGTATFGFGGWGAAGLLIAFFVSSSGMSRLAKSRKGKLVADFAKGGRRDWGQVIANGGLAAASAAAYGVLGGQVWITGLVGALAAVNADTWATELGVLSSRKPRLITTLQPVRAGVSGGVTPEGLWASLAGAGLIAGLGAWWWADGRLLFAGLVAGFVGSLFDSLLGASIQAMYFCPVCDRETERFPEHSCGSKTHLVRGWAWLNNDVVNFIAGGLGAGLAVVLVAVL